MLYLGNRLFCSLLAKLTGKISEKECCPMEYGGQITWHHLPIKDEAEAWAFLLKTSLILSLLNVRTTDQKHLMPTIKKGAARLVTKKHY